MSFSTFPVKSLLAAGAVAAALFAPSVANAGVLVSSAGDCDTQEFSQPFLPWSDPAYYTLHPGGDFEKKSDPWSGGSLVPGNEPWNAGPQSDNRSLALGAGESTVSPSICVGIEHPDIRFFAKGSGTLASLRVEVLFEDAAGNVNSLPIGTLNGANDWMVSPPFVIGANMLALLPGDHTAVAFRVTAASGNWQIDDFYVDPYTRW